MTRALILVAVMVALHALLWLIAAFRLIIRHDLNAAHLCWSLFVPVAGPCAVLTLAHRQHKPNIRYMVEMDTPKKNLEQHEGFLKAHIDAAEAVPLEEALLINEPRRRRALMLNILRTDPKRYLDLLLLARFNDDTETAHYATATIMELQRNIQLEVQRCQARVDHEPDSTEAWSELVAYLRDYIRSGLLEEHSVRRYRMLLRDALLRALALKETSEHLVLAVRNDLELSDADSARRHAQRLIELYPLDGDMNLEMLRVLVATRDRRGLHELLDGVRSKPMHWTHQSREQFKFWTEVK